MSRRRRNPALGGAKLSDQRWEIRRIRIELPNFVDGSRCFLEPGGCQCVLRRSHAAGHAAAPRALFDLRVAVYDKASSLTRRGAWDTGGFGTRDRRTWRIRRGPHGGFRLRSENLGAHRLRDEILGIDGQRRIDGVKGANAVSRAQRRTRFANARLKSLPALSVFPRPRSCKKGSGGRARGVPSCSRSWPRCRATRPSG